MSYVNFGFNTSEGYRKVRVHVDRVPCEGERVEFRNPNGAAAEVDPELDGNSYYVAEVFWATFWGFGQVTASAQATVMLVPKSEYLADVG